MEQASLTGKTVLVTGAARRLGAAIVDCLHSEGMNIILHYRSSADLAEQIKADLEKRRADSVKLIQADLLNSELLPGIIEQAQQRWGRLDALINNASSFYPTPLDSASEADWDDLIGSNLKAPFFLSQAAAPWLRQTRGCIINMVDIHSRRPRADHPIYSIAKAGLSMLTQSLAWELSPQIRVNAIAPGSILWGTEEQDNQQMHAEILSRVPMQDLGDPQDIARAALFLLRDAPYITGQTITVDGGRSLSM